MAERVVIRVAKPEPENLKVDSFHVLKDTVVLHTGLPDDFNVNDFRLSIFSVGRVSIHAVDSNNGGALMTPEQLKGAFIGGYLGLYVPQKRDGDQMLVEVETRRKYSSEIDRSRTLITYKRGEWSQITGGSWDQDAVDTALISVDQLRP